MLRRFKLPAGNGHDLFPYFRYKQEGLRGRGPDTAKGLFVAVGDGVYVFDLAASKFVPFGPLAQQADVKSITDNLRTGQIVYNRAEGKSWWSRRAHFLKPAETRALPSKIGGNETHLYKVRWNQPNPFSYRLDAERLPGR